MRVEREGEGEGVMCVCVHQEKVCVYVCMTGMMRNKVTDEGSN